jgi:hypothetical protein
MMAQQALAVVMIVASSVLTGWAAGDITFPAILGMLGLLGIRRRFTWDIRPERQFITPLLLLLLAVLFSLHCRYAHVRVDHAAFAWQTIARYFLSCLILILFLRPHRTRDFGFRLADGGGKEAVDANPPSALHPAKSIVSLPASLGLFHLANVLAAGQILLLNDRYVAFRLLELLSVSLVILYAALDGRQGRLGDFGGRTRGARQARFADGRAALARSFRPGLGSWLPLTLLLVAVNLGWIGGSLLYRHVEAINLLPAWLSRGGATLEGTTSDVAHVGFSSSGRLSSILSIMEDTDTALALTIIGDYNPGYLRARAFESYRDGQWFDLSAWEPVASEQNTLFGVRLVGRTYLYHLHEVEERDLPSLHEVTIRHESVQGDALFTPWGTCFVEAPFDVLMCDDGDIVNSQRVRNRQSYRVGYESRAGGQPPTGLQLRQMLAVPNSLNSTYLQGLKNRIFGDCTTTAQKIEAVTRYFHTNYTYALGLEVPPERDALDYFLREASSGYCEYFASGAAILLRMAKVPTRYVTGFLVTERGDDGKFWIARNMHAHAWVEAWDGPVEGVSDRGSLRPASDLARDRSAPAEGARQGQWVIVEATTQEGMGDTSLADELVRSAGTGRPFLTQLVQSLYEYGAFGVLGRLLNCGILVANWRWAPWALVIAALALGLALALRRSAGSRTVVRNPQLEALHKLLAVMDRKARALGYRRQSDETLHAFAGRIERRISQLSVAGPGPAPDDRQAALESLLVDWYLQYAGLRYCRAIDPARVEQLRQIAQKPR